MPKVEIELMTHSLKRYVLPCTLQWRHISGKKYRRPSVRMDMAAVRVAVTRTVSTGVVFLEYCVTF